MVGDKSFNSITASDLILTQHNDIRDKAPVAQHIDTWFTKYAMPFGSWSQRLAYIDA
jgi:hypothetical protein